MISHSFYRRPLPDQHVPFSSPEGRLLFREALSAGTLEGFFALSEQFHTQAEPAFCGLGSLVVALNALAIDPGRLWKGPWRWFGEDMLDCCVPLEQVAQRGLTLSELACLARCNGARTSVVRASQSSAGELRAAVRAATTAVGGEVLIAAYDRAALGQTGSGHYSPIGGYHEARDLALVMDVARFKYPPHWVSVERLFAAMLAQDPVTHAARGWVSLRADLRPRPLLLRLGSGPSGLGPSLDVLASALRELRGKGVQDIAAVLATRASDLAPIVEQMATSLDEDLPPEHRAQIDELALSIQRTEVFRVATALLPEARAFTAEVVSVLAWALSSDSCTALDAAFAQEVMSLREQIDALCSGGRA